MSHQFDKGMHAAMLVLPAALVLAWAVQVIGTGSFLAGLGTLGLLAYRADRGGHGALLAPAGAMLGLGAGLVAADMAGGARAVWPVVAALFGLGLLLVHASERRQVWALFFGAPLVVVGTAAMVILMPAMVVLPLLGGLVAIGLARAARGGMVPAAVLARAGARARAPRGRVAAGR